jgi:hypothetical protein
MHVTMIILFFVSFYGKTNLGLEGNISVIFNGLCYLRNLGKWTSKFFNIYTNRKNYF